MNGIGFTPDLRRLVALERLEPPANATLAFPSADNLDLNTSLRAPSRVLSQDILPRPGDRRTGPAIAGHLTG
jgi:hypothetical protein